MSSNTVRYPSWWYHCEQGAYSLDNKSITPSTHRSRYYSWLHSAVEILEAYDGGQPFSYFLKKYFASRKKFGSSDRRQVSRLCYAYFRLGKSYMDEETGKRILRGLRNCYPDLEEGWLPLLEEAGLSKAGMPQHIFPWQSELSDGIRFEDFEHSFLIQPDLFLRARPHVEDLVEKRLRHGGIEFEREQSSFRLSNSQKIDTLLNFDNEAVIQDISSQKTGQILVDLKNKFPPDEDISVYDACAASGGKSILACDILKKVKLTVSDIRPAILNNLRKRFKRAGIDHYHAFVADLTTGRPPVQELFDLVIADVPCTGSGTWSRTPEQLFYFDPASIADFAFRQKKIVENIIGVIRPGGYLLYITCSVFKQENEEQLAYFSGLGLTVVRKSLIWGYNQRADTLFAALMKKE